MSIITSELTACFSESTIACQPSVPPVMMIGLIVCSRLTFSSCFRSNRCGSSLLLQSRTKHNPFFAIEIMQAAVYKREAEVLFSPGGYCCCSAGVELNYDAAIDCSTCKVDQNIVLAGIRIKDLFSKGIVLKRDPDMPLPWYKAAAGNRYM